MRLIRPPRLKKGGLIGLVSPAGTPLPPEKVEKAVIYLEARGYRVEVGPNARKVNGYLAGTDDERASDFNMMARRKDVDAIFSLRGGYGTPRILRRIDYAALRRNPKIICGFSDITGLHLAIYLKCGLVTFSSPMPAVEFWKEPDPFTEEQFWEMVTSPKPMTLKNPENQAFVCEKTGESEARLIPANLSLLASQLGTPFCPNLQNSILVVEEVDEVPYRVDRMFAHLLNADILGRLAGLVLGQFTLCDPKDKTKPSLSIREVLQQAVEWAGCPSFSNFAYGHVARKVTVPLGVMAKLNARKGTLKLLEGAVE